MFQLPATSYSLGTNASGNMFATNPVFINPAQPAGANTMPRTADDGLALSACSPAVNAGVTLSPVLPVDILGNNRVGNYDIGAYEYQGAAPILAGVMSGD